MTAKKTQEARGSCVPLWPLAGRAGSYRAKTFTLVAPKQERVTERDQEAAGLCRTSAVDGMLPGHVSCEPLLLGKSTFSCPGRAPRSRGRGSATLRGGDPITRPESRVHNPKAPHSRKATGNTTHPQAEPWRGRGPRERRPRAPIPMPQVRRAAEGTSSRLRTFPRMTGKGCPGAGGGMEG